MVKKTTTITEPTKVIIEQGDASEPASNTRAQDLSDSQESMRNLMAVWAQSPYIAGDPVQASFRARIEEDLRKGLAGTTGMALQQLIMVCYGLGLTAGWWHDPKTGDATPNRNFGDICSLIHSEISEAYEAHRKSKKDDHLPTYDGRVVEMGDALIREFDWLGANQPLIGVQAILDKLLYNMERADHKIDNRNKEGGKQL